MTPKISVASLVSTLTIVGLQASAGAGPRHIRSCSPRMSWEVAHWTSSSHSRHSHAQEPRPTTYSTHGIPNGDDEDYEHTNGPSAQAALHAPGSRWEPRQAVSLAKQREELVRQGLDIDMVTLTIGGNDIGFSDVLASCAVPDPRESDFTCNEDDLRLSWPVLEDRVAALLDELRILAPHASIFVLGYPYITPVLQVCTDVERYIVSLGVKPFRDSDSEFFHNFYRLKGFDVECIESLRRFNERIDRCDSLYSVEIAREIAFSGISDFVKSVLAFGASYMWYDRARIDPVEAVFLQRSADRLNAAVADAASRVGAHFVDVAGGVASPDGPLSFEGHSPCDASPWTNGFVVDDRKSPAVSGRTFHPTAAGHKYGYSEILFHYIKNAVDDGVALNQAGLPVNPLPARTASQGSGGASGAAGPRGDGSAGGSQAEQGSSVGLLLVEQTAPAPSACHSAFVSPGALLELTASGFAPGGPVDLSGLSVSLGTGDVRPLAVKAAAADGSGFIRVPFALPVVPGSQQDLAPRAYAFVASGPGARGGLHTARMIEPLVAHPGAAPCAAPDSARTMLGSGVRIPVLANDTAPDGGWLDPASLRVRAAVGGSFTVDTGVGVVDFTPEAGFAGIVRTSYVVHDSWGVAVRGDITVTVDAGCTITGRPGAVAIDGTAGDDVICVPDTDDRRSFHVIDAGDGDDVIIGGAGVEWIYAGSGDDVIYAGGEIDRIDPGEGRDVIYGGTATDVIYNADVADTVRDDPGGYELVVAVPAELDQAGPVAVDDWVYADVDQTVTVEVLGNDHDPNDDLEPSTLRITRQPVSGTARAVVSAASGAAIEYIPSGSGSDSFAYEVCDRALACSSAEVAITVGTAVCSIIGTEGPDTLFGTSEDDVICGLGGDDIIFGLGGDDIIIGGIGDDRLWGGGFIRYGPADDGDDRLWGGAGDDSLHGGTADDSLWGGFGADALIGGDGDDALNGGDGDDIIFGETGDDRLWGGAGEDRLHGQDGNDSLHGGSGDDSLIGGDGDDAVRGQDGGDNIFGGPGDDSLHGGSGGDVLDGGPGSDSLIGGEGRDFLDGGHGDDTLWGASGDDTLIGGSGDDRLWGATGDDSLIGGVGHDHLNGGDGIDACTQGETATRCDTEGGTR